MTYRFVPAFGLRLIQLIILVKSILRGIMYLAVQPNVAVELTPLEQTAPLAVWGTIFITFGVLGLFGEALMSGCEITHMRSQGNIRAWPSFIAHASLTILYITLAVAYSASVYRHNITSMALTPFDMLMLAYLHWLFARRRKSHVG